MPSKRPHLTAADSAWLQMETPTNLMTITGLMMLKGRLEVEKLRELFKEKLLAHERFNRRIGRARGGLGRHRWEPHEIENTVAEIAGLLQEDAVNAALLVPV